ncbi:hypothetical protein MKY48_22920 [Paenibacillus sp. FSL W8-0187]|uniref:hypothetical protein n=1 Tax=Paenibacillus TaxID=44249 RepID=UPI0030DB3BCE
MPYFDRTRKCSIVFLTLSAFFFIVTVITFFNSEFPEILAYNFTNDLRGSLLTVIFLLISIILLVVGIAMRAMFKDAKEDFYRIDKLLRDLEKRD